MNTEHSQRALVTSFEAFCDLRFVRSVAHAEATWLRANQFVSYSQKKQASFGANPIGMVANGSRQQVACLRHTFDARELTALLFIATEQLAMRHSMLLRTGLEIAFDFVQVRLRQARLVTRPKRTKDNWVGILSDYLFSKVPSFEIRYVTDDYAAELTAILPIVTTSMVAPASKVGFWHP